ncbi:TonB-dependent receptor [Halioxenophilus sp. WMMB6]|uniref:TonB-dependent receptor n=1 Tax=Halioxenophilus sp. WMMB6 TaxID=3073815 RepID=UPI00295E8EE3|nr:TonB-dependent receptor [Halioxenophilus sp. WMMB6]
MRLSPLLVPLFGVACLPTIAAAQSSSSSVLLEEVVVTAQRREQSLQDVGLAVNVLTGSNMLENGVTTAEDMSAQVPALEVGGGGGANTTFFVRGVGNFTVNGYSDPATAFNYDDVYLARPTSAKNMFFDIGRVEVLKGPQGTLYGRNATAGAINVIPARPEIGVVDGYVSGSLGNYSSHNVQGAVNLPIGDSSALRISGLSAQHDGYMTDDTSDEDIQAARIQFLTDLSDSLTIRLAADYSNSGGKGSGASYDGHYALNFQTGEYTYVPSGLDDDVGMFDPEAQAYRSQQFFGLSGRTADPLSDKIYLDDTYYGANAEITYTTAAGTLTVIPAYRKSELDNLFASPAFYGFIQEDDEQTSLEVRFASERIGLFDLILGGHYFDETVDGNYTFSQQALAAYQDFESDTESTAFFVDATANITESFRAIAGVRYTSDKKNMDGQADVYLVQCTNFTMFGPSCPDATLLPLTDSADQLGSPFIVPTIPGPFGATPVGTSDAVLTWAPTPNHSSRKSEEVTWRAGIEFDITQDAMLYATYSTGYRSGGFSLAYGFETFEPEYLDAMTLGLKSRLLDNRLQLNLEAFYWEYTDQQIAHTGVDGRGNQGLFVENIGESTNQGLEAEMVFLPTTTTRVNAVVQYLDATYDKFVFTQPIGATPPLTGCDAAITGSVYSIDCSGQDAFQSPEWVVNLGVEQVIPMGDFEWVAKLDTQYKDERVIGFEYLEHDMADSFWRTNASLSFAPTADSWSITAWVHNIEDERQPNTAPVNTGLALGNVVYEAPRTYGLRFDMNF